MHADVLLPGRPAYSQAVRVEYEFGDDLLVQLSLYQSVRGAPDVFDERLAEITFVDSHEIVDACAWFYDSPSTVQVAVPPLALL